MNFVQLTPKSAYIVMDKTGNPAILLRPVVSEWLTERNHKGHIDLQEARAVLWFDTDVEALEFKLVWE
jgi:hypothetical protein